MRFIRIVLTVISAALVLTGCSANNERQPDNPAQTSQISSNDTSSSETGGANQWNNGISNNTLQRYANIDGSLALVDDAADASMGEAQTLADFVAWGPENCPAENMGLVFWNHGGGSISGVCFDENHDKDSLSLREIDTALNSVYDKMTEKFEFIGFDACLMSTLETANILVPYANYMFASEETEPGGGWNYTDILNYLAQNPSADGAALGKMQCESYVNHCEGTGDEDIVTFAITDLSKLDELLVSFDKTEKEMYESGKLNEIARSITGADNFGGNNRSEGYTNMVDLKGLLNAVQSYAPSAAETLQKLENAVICKVNGSQHSSVGGISLYYPLAVQGSQELAILSYICTSSWYLAFVDKVAYGTTGNNFNDYDNTYILDDCDDLWDDGYAADENIGVNYEDFLYCDENSTIGVEDVYIDEDGYYAVELNDMDLFNYAICCVFAEFGDVSVYLGEDDNVDCDFDNMVIYDNFTGEWASLDGMPLAIELVYRNDDASIYTCPILLNGEYTNLRILYDRNRESWKGLGTWGGIDYQTGASARETVPIKNGDVIKPLYRALTDNGEDYIENDLEYTVNGEIRIEFEPLGDGDFSYSMILYDVFGNYYFTDTASVYVDENGYVVFDMS